MESTHASELVRERSLRDDGYASETEMAGYLGKSVVTLRKWRREGTGPTWVKFGKTVLYPVGGTRTWLKSLEQTPVRNRRTS